MTPFLNGAVHWIYAEDPPPVCPECGYDWSIDAGEALALVETSPDRYEAALRARTG